MYTIKALADLAGITRRSLRYYDEIGLLKPSSVNQAGYRLYDEKAVDLLQQIMFYKRIQVSLNDIKSIIYDENFDKKRALLNHRQQLISEYENIKTLIHTIDQTIDTMEGRGKMTSKDKFEGFKKEMMAENEAKFGQEARQLFGETVEISKKKFMNLSQAEFKEIETLQEEMHKLFVEAMGEGPRSEKAQMACGMHQKWIKYFWTHYSKEAHLGLVEMYVADERFMAYYDQIKKDLAVFIRDAMRNYLK